MVLENLDVAGTATQIVDVLLIVVVVVIVLGVLAFFMFLTKFNKKVRLRYIINGNKHILDTVAREVKDRNGITWWQTLKKQKKFPLPPGEAIYLNTKGQKCVEAYVTENDDMVWIKDHNTTMEPPAELFENPPKELFQKINADVEEKKITEEEARIMRDKELKRWKNEKRKEWLKENNVVESFQPFTTNQRTILVNSTMKAVSRRKKGWGDKIVQLATVGILGLVIIAGMVMWGDMAEPVLKANNQGLEIEKQQTKQLEILEGLNRDIQKIKDQASEKPKDRGAPN